QSASDFTAYTRLEQEGQIQCTTSSYSEVMPTALKDGGLCPHSQTSGIGRNLKGCSLSSSSDALPPRCRPNSRNLYRGFARFVPAFSWGKVIVQMPGMTDHRRRWSVPRTMESDV